MLKYLGDETQEDYWKKSAIFFDEGAAVKCEGYSLKYICDGNDEVVKDYVDKTTEVVNSFNFE